jgi:hypothetical protein
MEKEQETIKNEEFKGQSLVSWGRTQVRNNI